MHELGVVFHIIKEVEKIAMKNNVNKIKTVTLDIGEVSTIVNPFLKDCWDWASKRSTILDGAKLKINTIKAETYCEDCGKNYKTVKYGKICPRCQSSNTYLIKGNETIIKQIEVLDK